MYLPGKPPGSVDVVLLDCLREIKSWMLNNFHRLNNDKTEIIAPGPSKRRAALSANLGQLSLYAESFAENLSESSASELCSDKQISSVVKTSSYHLRSVDKIKSYLSYLHLQKVLHAFVTSRLDYCFGLPRYLLLCLQLTGIKTGSHLSPHFIGSFNQFKVLLMVFKTLDRQTHSYSTHLIYQRSVPRSLRSDS